MLGAVTASLPGNGHLRYTEKPILQLRRASPFVGAEEALPAFTALPDGSPESLGSWKFLPALPPTPGGWALIVLRLSFLPSPPLHVPRQGRGSPKGLSFSSSAADVCLQSGAKCHEAPAESLSQQQRSLICAGRPFLPGVGCDPEACVQVFEASDRSLWLSQLSAAARGVWFPDRGSHSAPDAGSTDLSPLGHQRSPVASARKTERKKTQPVAAIQNQGLQRQRGERGLGAWSCREGPLFRESAVKLLRTRGSLALGAAW